MIFYFFWVVAMETGNFLKMLNDASLASLGFVIRRFSRYKIWWHILWVLHSQGRFVTEIRWRCTDIDLHITTWASVLLASIFHQSRHCLSIFYCLNHFRWLYTAARNKFDWNKTFIDHIWLKIMCASVKIWEIMPKIVKI
jgi:hypothetical protein